jgi:hypothetical protein
MTKPVIANNMLAISNLDFFTAGRLLGDRVNYRVSDNKIDLVTIDPASVILFRSWSLLSLAKPLIGSRAIAIVCIPKDIADIYRIPVIDSVSPNNKPRINFILLKVTRTHSLREIDLGLQIPMMNIDEVMIAKEVRDIKENQIISHILTYTYAVPRSASEEVWHDFLKWLAGKLTTGDFHDKYNAAWVKSAKVVNAYNDLIAFMDSEKGVNYQKVFTRIFVDKEPKSVAINAGVTSFEVNYFTSRLAKYKIL